MANIVESKLPYLRPDSAHDMEANTVDESVGHADGTKSRGIIERRPSLVAFAKELINLTSTGATRLRKYYLDRLSLELTDQLIGRSSASEVFRGFLDGKPVAVKRTQMDVIDSRSRRELKDLLTEIDFLSRSTYH
jgi:hypothetical protein